jgi:hypothetical protein
MKKTYININQKGAKEIKKFDGTLLAGADLKPGELVYVYRMKKKPGLYCSPIKTARRKTLYIYRCRPCATYSIYYRPEKLRAGNLSSSGLKSLRRCRTCKKQTLDFDGCEPNYVK